MRQLLLISALITGCLAYSQESSRIVLQKNARQSLLPYDRIIQPAGRQIVFGPAVLENHSLDAALSPDGNWIAVEERYSIAIINTRTNSLAFILPNSSGKELAGGMNTYSGITWYNGISGPEIFWSAVTNDDRSLVVSATWNGKEARFSRVFEYNTIPPAVAAIPNELLIRSEKGKDYIYVVLNGCNRVIKQDLATKDTVWITQPGVAPYGITMAAGKLYVTNWAGGIPDADDKEIAGVPWGAAKVDNKNAGGATREGSVTVINPYTGKVLKHISVGLHPNDITSDRSGRYVYVTNSNSDNVSVIKTSADAVTETISVRLQAETNPFFGDSPNGLCLSGDGRVLYVANGMDNAVAVISLGKKSSRRTKEQESRVMGFIPTGAYPSAVTLSPGGMMYVCNLEGEGVKVKSKVQGTETPVYNSHRMLATVSVIPVPGEKDLSAYTDTVVALNNLSRAMSSRQKPRENTPAKPVPERIGEPSLFKHVLYIIKENRTYDQVLGDMKEGKGMPSLCIYGENITPNQHRLAREFLLLDNYNASGKCSAEGHQWTDASIVTDYIEKNMRAWFRSYAHVQTDALVYSPTGFLWDNALKHGKSVRIYGEASEPRFSSEMTWTEVYNAFRRGEKVNFTNVTTIDPVRPILSQTYPSYGNHEFTDVMRADDFIRELRHYESLEGDQLPELMIMALPNNHTAGTRPGYPTPRAMVADNDLALGQIVEAVSKSRFWKNTVIFVTEDDSQGGWDHISAFRTVGFVISPWSRLKSTNSSYYAQPSMVRTIEQILGLPPMNIQDAIAATMSDCFGNEPDFTPYECLPNNIPLDEMNPSLSSLSGKALHYAKMSMLPQYDGIDSGHDDLLNRILWHAAKGNAAYPARYAGTAESEEDEDDF